MRKHRATVIISRASQFYMCDVISRSRKVRFTPCLRNIEEQGKGKGITMVQWVNRVRNKIFVNPLPLPLPCKISGALHLAQPGLMAGRQADKIQANFEIFKIGCRLKYSSFCFI